MTRAVRSAVSALLGQRPFPFISSTIVPVSRRVREGDVGPQGPNTFAISAPGGSPLVDALVSSVDLADARRQYRTLP